AEQRGDQLAQQLSGGLRQRAMIAMALSCSPTLLIADEPTTALDVTTQTQILELMRQLQREDGMAIMLITHDLGVIAEMATDVAVMYLGRVVGQAPVDAIFHAPEHPYTQALLPSIPPMRARSRAADADRRLGAASLRSSDGLPLPSALPGLHRGHVRPADTGAPLGGQPAHRQLLPLRMSAVSAPGTAHTPLLRVAGLQKL